MPSATVTRIAQPDHGENPNQLEFKFEDQTIHQHVLALAGAGALVTSVEAHGDFLGQLTWGSEVRIQLTANGQKLDAIARVDSVRHSIRRRADDTAERVEKRTIRIDTILGGPDQDTE